MLAAALAFAILAQTAPTEGVRWGEHEWLNGTGFLSRYHFVNRTGFPSAHYLRNDTGSGSIHYLFNATTEGSSYFWENGVRPGSRYFWRTGHEPGSRYYWEHGQGCLSRYGWRGAATTCTSGEVVVFQTLCIARAIDVAPCRAINAELDQRVSRSDSSASTYSAGVLARMRAGVEGAAP